jgi:hypothetical protein
MWPQHSVHLQSRVPVFINLCSLINNQRRFNETSQIHRNVLCDLTCGRCCIFRTESFTGWRRVRISRMFPEFPIHLIFIFNYSWFNQSHSTVVLCNLNSKFWNSSYTCHVCHVITVCATATSPLNYFLSCCCVCSYFRSCISGQLSRSSDSLRLDGPGIESRYGTDFPHTSRPALGPTQPPIQWVPGLFPMGKAAGAWR